MTTHLADLGLRERAPLEKHRGRDGELADIVKQGAQAEDRHTLFFEPDPRAIACANTVTRDEWPLA